jgi:lipopolysaccharide transport system ATP-binding protein
MKGEIIVKFKNVSKIYDIKSKNGGKLYALNGVNLTVRSGERIGIMGNNGAGKSTLLKVISGIVKPSIGSVEIRKKVVSLMSLEDGFKLDLTGRENILLNGLLVGMDSGEINRKTEEIIEYSELRDFIDEPFYKYSAGMKFRLGFSIAMASRCDLLILDEILTAGDFSFQQRAFKSIVKLQKEKRQIATIICSHMPDLIWAFSDKYLLMDNGVLKEINREGMIKIVKSKHDIWNRLLKLTDFGK